MEVAQQRAFARGGGLGHVFQSIGAFQMTTVTVTVGRPPFVATDAGKALAAHARGIYAELDGRRLALVPTTGGATDAAFAGRSGKAVVVESFGLAGFGYHARDEYIEIDSIVPRLYLAARLMMDIGAGRAPLR